MKVHYVGDKKGAHFLAIWLEAPASDNPPMREFVQVSIGIEAFVSDPSNIDTMERFLGQCRSRLATSSKSPKKRRRSG
jgi:hypothetical protein